MQPFNILLSEFVDIFLQGDFDNDLEDYRKRREDKKSEEEINKNE